MPVGGGVGTGGSDFSDIKARIQQLKLDVDKHKVGQQLNACQHSLRGALSAQKQLDSLSFLQSKGGYYSGEVVRGSVRENGLGVGKQINSRSYPVSVGNSRPSSVDSETRSIARSLRSIDRLNGGEDGMSSQYTDDNGQKRPMRSQLFEVKKNLERIGEELRSSRSSQGTTRGGENIPPPEKNIKRETNPPFVAPSKVPDLDLHKTGQKIHRNSTNNSNDENNNHNGHNTSALLSARHSHRIKALEKQLAEIHCRLQKDNKLRKKSSQIPTSSDENNNDFTFKNSDIYRSEVRQKIPNQQQQQDQLQRKSRSKQSQREMYESQNSDLKFQKEKLQIHQQPNSNSRLVSKELESHMVILNKAKDDQLAELQKQVSQLKSALLNEHKSWEHKFEEMQLQQKQIKDEKISQLLQQLEQVKSQLWKERSAYETACVELNKKDDKLRQYEKWSQEQEEGATQQHKDLIRQMQVLKDQLHECKAGNAELEEQLQLRSAQMQNMRQQLGEKELQLEDFSQKLMQKQEAIVNSQNSNENNLKRLQVQHSLYKNTYPGFSLDILVT